MKNESNVIDMQEARLEDEIKKATKRYLESENETLERALVLGGLLLQLRLQSESYEIFRTRVSSISDLSDRHTRRLLRLAKHESVVHTAMKDSGVNSIRGALAVVKGLPDPEGYKPPQQKRGRKPGTKNKRKPVTGWAKEAVKGGILPISAGGSKKKEVREQIELVLGHSVSTTAISSTCPEAEEIRDAVLTVKWGMDPEAADEDADRLEAVLSATAKKRLAKAVESRVAAKQAAFMGEASKALAVAIDKAVGEKQQKLDSLQEELYQRDRELLKRERGVQKLMNGIVSGIDDLKSDFRILKQVAHPDKFNGKPEVAQKAMHIIKALESALLVRA